MSFFHVVQIGAGPSKATLNGYASNDAGKQFWKMSFQGEGGIDAGGLFRDSVREICAELQSEGSLKLLLPCPNQKRMGSSQSRWIVNPALGDKKSLEMYQFIGTIMGASLLWEASVELDLPGLVWKQLIGQKANWADLIAVDEAFCRKIIETRTVSEAEWVAGQQKWVVVTSSGRIAELRRGGADLIVPYIEKDEYLDACVEYRLSEGRKQIEAMRTGFFGLVPTLGLQFLDWHQVEKLVCGTPVIDIELLKKITSYNNMSDNEKHPVAVMFWNVMESFSNEERAQVMAFAWGRRRMPPQVKLD
jgi:E3 ubiquitin-protein ligase HERC2